jgi:hypothetical protein
MKNQTINHIVVLAIYTVLAIMLTWPVMANITTHVAGSGGDPWQTLWRLADKEEMLKEAWWEDGLIELVKREFLGQGEARLVNISVWPWLPIIRLFGVVAGYNIIWLGSFVLAGYGMYLLVSWLTKTYGSVGLDSVSEVERGWNKLVAEAPSFLAGLAYMLLPYHVAHARGHFGAMQIQWLPLIILTSWALVRRPSLVKTLILISLVTLQAWTEHHYLLWLIIFGIWYVVYFRAEVRDFSRDKMGRWYLWLLVIGVAITVGLSLGPTIKLAGQENSQLDLGQEQIIRYSADPFAYVVPASFHSFWGTAASKVWGNYFTGNVEEATLFVGLLPILMVGFFWQRIPSRQLKFWLITAGLFGVISLGPKLHLLGYVTGIPLPWELVNQWPVMNAVRTVARAGVMVNLAWTVLFGWVLATQVKRISIAGIIGLFIILEFLFIPMPMMSAHMPRVYSVIKDRPGAAIVEIPTATNYTVASRALFGSLIHGKKVLNNIALERAEGAQAYAEVRSMPALRQLLYLRTGHILEQRDEFMEQDMTETLSDVSRWLDVRQILVHPDSLSDLQKEAVIIFLERTSGLKREVVDDVWLYDISQLPVGDGVFVVRDDGWGEVGREPNSNEVVAGIKDTALLTIYNINDRPVRVQLGWKVGWTEADLLQIEGRVNMAVNWNEEKGVQTLDIVAQPGQNKIIFKNSRPQAVIIREPVMQVLNGL